MRGFKFNFITILAFVLLVVYAYLAAMGLLYSNRGVEILHAGGFFLGVIAVVSLCIYLMCRAKATRWQEKIGRPAQIVLGLVIVATFFFISKPFSSYVTMMGQKSAVYQEIDSVVISAKNLNDAYKAYVDERMSNYAPVESSVARRDIRTNALRLQLIPPDLAAKQPDRNKWLDEIADMKLHNIQMPNNLTNMETCVDLWMKDYASMSGVIFEDEHDVVPFEYATFATKYENLRNRLGGYSIWALIVAIICSIFMLIPYFTTDTDISLKEGSSEGWFAKWWKKSFAPDKQYTENDTFQDNDGDYM